MCWTHRKQANLNNGKINYDQWTRVLPVGVMYMANMVWINSSFSAVCMWFVVTELQPTPEPFGGRKKYAIFPNKKKQFEPFSFVDDSNDCDLFCQKFTNSLAEILMCRNANGTIITLISRLMCISHTCIHPHY